MSTINNLRTRARSLLDRVHHLVNGPLYDVSHRDQHCRLSMPRPHHRIREPGAFEPEAMRAVDDALDDGGRLWEVGARWGVYSFLWADRAGDVHAFEADHNRVGHMLRSREVNRADNVSVHCVELTSDRTLNQYQPAPDVGVVDLEGMEYELLPASEQTLARGSVWIVEAHEFDHLDSEPEDLVRLFDGLGFGVRMIEDSQYPRTRLVAELI